MTAVRPLPGPSWPGPAASGVGVLGYTRPHLQDQAPYILHAARYAGVHHERK
jgi:hypothetical protein